MFAETFLFMYDLRDWDNISSLTLFFCLLAHLADNLLELIRFRKGVQQIVQRYAVVQLLRPGLQAFRIRVTVHVHSIQNLHQLFVTEALCLELIREQESACDLVR